MGQAAKLFQADIKKWTRPDARNPNGPARIELKARSYTMPAELEPHVRDVGPFTHFVEWKLAAPAGQAAPTNVTVGRENCETLVTPDCVRNLYGILDEPGKASHPGLGIAYPEDAVYDEADFIQYIDTYGQGVDGLSGYRVQTYYEPGVQADLFSADSSELRLDVQVPAAIVAPIPTKAHVLKDNSEDIFLKYFECKSAGSTIPSRCR